MIREVICDYCGKASWTDQPFKRFCNRTCKSNWHGVNNPKTIKRRRIYQRVHWKETYERTREFQLKRRKIYKENHKEEISKWGKDWRIANPNYMSNYFQNNKEWASEYSKQYRIKKALNAEEQ